MTVLMLVPVLTYHDIGPQAKGRLVISAKSFEEQMRYLKEQGYRVISLSEFHEFLGRNYQGTVQSIADNNWDDDIIATLDEAITRFKQMFLGKEEELRINEPAAEPMEGPQAQETITRYRPAPVEKR